MSDNVPRLPRATELTLGRGCGAARYGCPLGSRRRSKRGLNHDWGGCLRGGPSAAATLAAAFSSTAASTAALSAAAASSVAFFALTSVASLSAVAVEAAAASAAAPDVPGAAAGDIVANEPGSGVETAVGGCCLVDRGSPMGRPSLWSNLLLYKGVVVVRQHLVVIADGRHRLALSLAGVETGARYTRTTDYNSDLVQGGQLLQQPSPCHLVGTQGGTAQWKRGEAGGRRIGTQLPQQGPLHVRGQVGSLTMLKSCGVTLPSVLPRRAGA
jgi:hypothetical protein